MRYFFSVFLVIASPAFSQSSFATKADCLSQLNRIAMAASTYPKFPDLKAEELKSAPEGTEKEQERIIGAWSQIGDGYLNLQDALLDLCAAYE